MAEGEEDGVRDLGLLVVPAAGALVETGDPWEPYYLSDPGGGRVEPVSEFLRDLQAAGRPATTQRSYSLALLRWFRFTWVIEVPWNQATRTEARDFCRWIQLADKPGSSRRPAVPVPGKRPASTKYAPATVAHCETVCRGFYAYHLEAGTGPIVNPFPMARHGRAHAHHNPMDPFPRQKAGLFRPRVPRRAPRQIPDSVFNELFARLPSHRDRALVAFWVSTGARASELLGSACSGADPGRDAYEAHMMLSELGLVTVTEDPGRHADGKVRDYGSGGKALPQTLSFVPTGFDRDAFTTLSTEIDWLLGR
jgi:hypothetical protein